ncbi:MAG: hypothetical protein WCK02_16470 [Bacteroidota bacterium]
MENLYLKSVKESNISIPTEIAIVLVQLFMTSIVMTWMIAKAKK